MQETQNAKGEGMPLSSMVIKDRRRLVWWRNKLNQSAAAAAATAVLSESTATLSPQTVQSIPGTDIHGPHRMNYSDLSDGPSFHPTLQIGQNFYIHSDMS